MYCYKINDFLNLEYVFSLYSKQVGKSMRYHLLFIIYTISLNYCILCICCHAHVTPQVV